MKNLLKELTLFPLFKGINESEILPLLSCLTFKQRSYSQDEVIIREDDQIDFVGLILSGKAHVEINDFWGNRHILTNLTKGELFGEVLALSGGKNTSGITVVSQNKSEILFLNFKRLITMCSASCDYHNKIIANLLAIVGEKNLIMTEKMRCLSKKTTREKLLAYLSSQSRKQEKNQFYIPFDRQQLADYLSVDRSAMSKELAKMHDEGLIDYKKNLFTLKI